jgi:hypothetical protein
MYRKGFENDTKNVNQRAIEKKERKRVPTMKI